MRPTLYLIFGDDDFLVEEAARQRIDAVIPPADRETCLETIDGHADTGDEALRRALSCIGSMQTPGFFGAAKVTWLRDATFLTGGSRVAESAAAKSATEQLAKAIAGLGADSPVTLVITAQKVLKASVFCKTCLKAGEVLDLGNNLKPWEQKKAAEDRFGDLLESEGLEMDPDARREFLDRVGYDTRLIVQELRKLKLYLHPKVVAAAADIRAICSVGREAQAWDVSDAFGQRDPLALLKALKPLAGDKSTPIIVTGMIEKELREMLVLREAYDRKWLYGGKSGSAGWASNLPPEASMLLNALGMNPKTMNAWMLRKKLPYALNYTLNELRIARYRIIRLREQLVSTDLPPMPLLEATLLRTAGRPPRTVAR